MYLVWLGAALLALKLLNVSVFADLSWWWVLAPFGAAFLWFELIEKRLGLDKKRAHDEYDETRRKRIANFLPPRDKPRR
jgi:small Trp-rich protein